MKTKGFTLIELIIVIAIIGILAGALIPVISGKTDDARKNRGIADIAAIRSAVLMYNADTGQWPRLSGTNITGIVVTDNANNWHGPYLNEMKTDPWGAAYTFTNTTATANGKALNVCCSKPAIAPCENITTSYQ